MPGTSRRRRWILVAVVVLVVGVVVLLATGGGRETTDRPPRTGVAVDIVFGEAPELIDRDVDDAADLGAEALRVAIQWPGYEPVRGQYASWYEGLLDRLVARARRRGLRVLLTPVFTPCWATPQARADPTACASPDRASALRAEHPADPEDYARLAVHLARRYGSSLAAVEVWNEPNLPSTWAPEDRERDYVRLTCATHSALRRSAPATLVLGGAVAGADVPFVERLYADGIEGCIDALSVHVYNDGRAPEAVIDQRFAAATYRQGLIALRSALGRIGERRPVWITEIGWNTSTQRGGAFNDGVTPEQQATYLADALRRLGQDEPALRVAASAFVYRLRDPSGPASDPQNGYGLLDAAGARKPAFGAVQRAFRERPPRPVAP